MGSKYKYKLSIIVPVYNVELYLERCVMSLLNQDMDPNQYEIILVNDGSTDGSGDIARRFKNNYPIVQLVEQTNGGLSAARNSGLDRAQGRYIMFVDSDDFIEPNVIGLLVSKAEQHDLDLLFYESQFYPWESRQTARQPFERDRVFSGDYAVTHGLFVGCVWSNIYSYDFILREKVRFYEGVLHEDVDFNFRLYPQACRLMFTDILVYHYYVGNASLTRHLSFEKQKKSLLDDILIASRIKSYACTHFSTKVRKEIEKRMNSTLVGLLIGICRNPSFNVHSVKQILEYAVQCKVYPISGRTHTHITSFVKYFINIKFLYFYFVYITRSVAFFVQRSCSK